MAESVLNRGDTKRARALLKGLDDPTAQNLRERLAELTGGNVRKEIDSRFVIEVAPKPEAPLAQARQLIEGADQDLSVIEELLTDG